MPKSAWLAGRAPGAIGFIPLNTGRKKMSLCCGIEVSIREPVQMGTQRVLEYKNIKAEPRPSVAARRPRSNERVEWYTRQLLWRS